MVQPDRRVCDYGLFGGYLLVIAHKPVVSGVSNQVDYMYVQFSGYYSKNCEKIPDLTTRKLTLEI